MKLLLDTHILIWLHSATVKLSDKAKDLLVDPLNEIYYSSVNIWEAQLKYLQHTDTYTMPGEVLHKLSINAGLYCIPVTAEHGIALKTLHYDDYHAPRSHKDPFDRMLIAQAKTERMYLLTHDSLIPYYNEDCIIKV